MDEMAKTHGTANNSNIPLRNFDALVNENRILRGTTGVLKQKLLSERSEVAQERAQLAMLREANEHLVLATFGAEDQQAAAEMANHHQTVFLSMLAHELRNPIASIAVANKVLLKTQMESAVAEKMAGIIGRQVDHLQRLVDDLLDVARVNTGKVSLQVSVLALRDVIDCALELSAPALAHRRQNTVVELPPALVLMGDMVRLSQLFSNLLLNASKFSAPDTTILVTACEHNGLVSVSVRDQGIGIEPADQLRIFDLFAQAGDKPAYAAGGGLGIGLALVKSIAHMHGGSVRVASDGIGCGSEFTVVLPLQPTAAPLPQARTPDTTDQWYDAAQSVPKSVL